MSWNWTTLIKHDSVHGFCGVFFLTFAEINRLKKQLHY